MKKNLPLTLSLIIYGIIFATLLTSCGTLAPFAEKKTAEETIAKAEKINSGTYAPTLFGDSVQAYSNGEGLIVTEEKHANNEKAKTEYLTSTKLGLDAYNKSIGPYTERFINETDEQIEKYRLERVDVISPEPFSLAVDLNANAQALHGDSKFLVALSNTYDARTKLEKAVSNKIYIKSQIDALDSEADILLQTAVEQKAKAATPDEYLATLEEQERIQQQTQEILYLKSLDDYPLLIEKINIMIKAIEAKRLIALKEFEEASEVIVQIKNTTSEVEEEIHRLNTEQQVDEEYQINENEGN